MPLMTSSQAIFMTLLGQAEARESFFDFPEQEKVRQHEVE
jgi:hypothetical protein